MAYLIMRYSGAFVFLLLYNFLDNALRVAKTVSDFSRTTTTPPLKPIYKCVALYLIHILAFDCAKFLSQKASFRCSWVVLNKMVLLVLTRWWGWPELARTDFCKVTVIEMIDTYLNFTLASLFFYKTSVVISSNGFNQNWGCLVR